MEALSTRTIGNLVPRAGVQETRERLAAAVVTEQGGCTRGDSGCTRKTRILKSQRQNGCRFAACRTLSSAVATKLAENSDALTAQVLPKATSGQNRVVCVARTKVKENQKIFSWWRRLPRDPILATIKVAVKRFSVRT